MPGPTLTRDQLYQQANFQLNQARTALTQEIMTFVREQSLAVFSQPVNPVNVETFNRCWTGGEPWQKFLDAFLDESRDSLAKEKEGRQLAHRLIEMGRWLAEEFTEEFDDLDGNTNPALMAARAAALGNFTQMWAIYREAWDQRVPKTGSGIKDGTRIPADIRAADHLVSTIYDVVQETGLRLRQRNQVPLVVPFISRVYATGSTAPTPYIVAPLWGHHQVWTWLTYAHEVGHHVLRNVRGLQQELKVNVAMALTVQNERYLVQRVYFTWLEEIFADLFAIAQVGPAFVQAQLRSLTLQVEDAALDALKRRDPVEKAFMVAGDITHPVPYLRARQSIKALELLGTPKSAVAPLRETWDNVFSEIDCIAIDFGVNESASVHVLERTRDVILDVILNTPLYALAARGDDQPRTFKDVFVVPQDATKAAAAMQAITGGESGGYDTQHLLAAMQTRLEALLGGLLDGEDPETVGAQIAALNDAVINAMPDAS